MTPGTIPFHSYSWVPLLIVPKKKNLRFFVNIYFWDVVVVSPAGECNVVVCWPLRWLCCPVPLEVWNFRINSLELFNSIIQLCQEYQWIVIGRVDTKPSSINVRNNTHWKKLKKGENTSCGVSEIRDGRQNSQAFYQVFHIWVLNVSDFSHKILSIHHRFF